MTVSDSPLCLEQYGTWDYSDIDGMYEFTEHNDLAMDMLRIFQPTVLETFTREGKPYMVMSIAPSSSDETSLLFIFDIENLLSPRMVSVVVQPEGERMNSPITDMAIKDGFIYCGLFGDSGLWAVDITDPTSPVNLGVSKVETNDNISVSGKHLYSTGQLYNGIIVCDISNPAEAKEIRKLDISTRDCVLETDGDLLLLGIKNILTVYDISSPDNPEEVAELKLDMSGGITNKMKWSGHKMNWSDWANIQDIQIKDNYAYIAFGAGNIRVVDLSSPEEPVEMKKINLPGFAISLTIENDLLYVSKSDYEATMIELAVIDISEIESPRLIDSTETEADFVFGGISFAYCWIRPQLTGEYILIPGREELEIFQLVKIPERKES